MWTGRTQTPTMPEQTTKPTTGNYQQQQPQNSQQRPQAFQNNGQWPRNQQNQNHQRTNNNTYSQQQQHSNQTMMAASQQPNYYQEQNYEFAPSDGFCNSQTIVWNATHSDREAPKGDHSLSIKTGYNVDRLTHVKFFHDLPSRKWRPRNPENDISPLSRLIIGNFWHLMRK